MTTKLKWRLGKLPDAHEVSLLLEKGVLTKEEAREILFSLETDEDRDKAGLQEEIKFLRELVQKLSNRSEIVSQIRYIEKPYQRYDWYEPYKFYCSSDNSVYTTTTTGSAITLMGASNDATNNVTSVSYSGEPSFTAIKTF